MRIGLQNISVTPRSWCSEEELRKFMEHSGPHILLTQNTEGKIAGVEVKSGEAIRNPALRAKDAEIANQGRKVVRKNAPENLRGRKVKFPTEERHYPD